MTGPTRPDPAQLALLEEGPAYATLLMDPPWLERGAGQCKRGADRHYPLMPVDQILRTILDSGSWRPAADSHLWCWVTDNYLPDGLWLMAQLGFTYKRTWQWVKMRAGQLQIGLGQYARGSHETLLFGTRGHLPVPPPEQRHSSVILAERTRHSAKPDASYAVIETVSPAPRIEFFCRTRRPGWDAWGNEV